jgi:hypothetical protein
MNLPSILKRHPRKPAPAVDTPAARIIGVDHGGRGEIIATKPAATYTFPKYGRF